MSGSQVVRLQPENKKPMSPADWKNGLKGRHLYLTPH